MILFNRQGAKNAKKIILCAFSLDYFITGFSFHSKTKGEEFEKNLCVFAVVIFLPDFPLCISCLPQFFQLHFIAHGVHALPETMMLVGSKLPVIGNINQRLLFPLRG